MAWSQHCYPHVLDLDILMFFYSCKICNDMLNTSYSSRRTNSHLMGQVHDLRPFRQLPEVELPDSQALESAVVRSGPNVRFKLRRARPHSVRSVCLIAFAKHKLLPGSRGWGWGGRNGHARRRNIAKNGRHSDLVQQLMTYKTTKACKNFFPLRSK